MILTRWCAALASAALLVTAGCTALPGDWSGPPGAPVQSGAPIQSGAAVGGEPAPEPKPRGALYGRVLHPDGYSDPRSSVSVYLYDDENDAKTAAAILTLGLGCLFGLCPGSVEADVGPRGLYSLPADELGDPAAGMQATARLDVDGVEFVPETTLALEPREPDGKPRRIPDLVHWIPEIQVTTAEDGRLRASWPEAAGLPVGGEVTYTLLAASTADHIPSTPAPLGAPATSAGIEADARVYAEAPFELMVAAQTSMMIDGELVEATYRSASVAQQGGLAPPSRGAGCLAEVNGSGQLRPAEAPCVLTDGVVDRRGDGVRLDTDCAEADGDASTAGKGCTDPDHLRVCVRLDPAKEVDLAVVRTPFPSGLVVDLLDGERRVLRSGMLPDDDPSADVASVGFDPPVRAQLACVRDENGTSVAGTLSEMSVW